MLVGNFKVHFFLYFPNVVYFLTIIALVLLGTKIEQVQELEAKLSIEN